MFELALVWSPGAQRNIHFEGFAGLRYIENEVDATFQLSTPNQPSERRIVDPSTADFLLGARYTAKLSDRSSATSRGDGSFGEGDGTYGAAVLLQYQTSGGAWVFGYRHLDYSSDALDQVLTGPAVGYIFKLLTPGGWDDERELAPASHGSGRPDEPGSRSSGR